VKSKKRGKRKGKTEKRGEIEKKEARPHALKKG